MPDDYYDYYYYNKKNFHHFTTFMYSIVYNSNIPKKLTVL